MNKIGTIEILRSRVYNLDAECHHDGGSTVVVEPGHYDLFSDGLTTFWMMRGKLNERGIWRMGDGIFSMRASDVPSDIEVVFPSKRWGIDEWADLLLGPEFTEGPAQRLRIHLDAEVGVS